MPRVAAQSFSYLHPDHARAGDPATLTDIYARVSRASDERLRSTEGQVEECLTRLDELNRLPGMVHVDNSLSAWSDKVVREAWDNLMRRLESRQTAGVIVFDLTRFSRKPRDGERLIDAAEHGLLVLDSENAYDLRTATGKKSFRDALAGAAYESDRLSTRVSRGKRTKARRGEPNISVRPFGFNMDLTPREDEAEILRELTRRFLAGESQDKLLAELNGPGGVTTTRGNQFSRSTLKAMLSRGINAGQVTYKGEVVQQLPGEPIISSDDLAAVQAMYAARRRGRPVNHLLTGWVYCHCGHKMYGKRVRYGNSLGPDGTRSMYHCNVSWGGCGNTIDGRRTDAHVLELVAARLTDPRHAGKLSTGSRKEETARAKINAELAKAEETATGLDDRLARGELTLERYDRIIAGVNERIATLKKDREALAIKSQRPTVDLSVSRDELLSRLSGDAMPLDEKRATVRLALGPNKILVGASPTRGGPFAVERLTIG